MLNKQYCCQEDWQPLLYISILIFYDVCNLVRFNQKFAGLFYGKKGDTSTRFVRHDIRSVARPGMASRSIFSLARNIYLQRARLHLAGIIIDS